MFSGIIEELGVVKALQKKGTLMCLDIQTDKTSEGVKIGDSISVNGVCLTVVRREDKILSFQAMPETVQSTTLRKINVGEKVNLERALKVGDRIGGHFVTGHVDCIGTIRSRKISKGNLDFQIGLPSAFLKYLIRKGSIAVDGISLTIADVKKGGFSVFVIPHTLKNTTLGFKSSSHFVNLELDILAKQAP